MKALLLTLILCCITATSFAANFDYAGKWQGKVTAMTDQGTTTATVVLVLKSTKNGTYRGTNTWSRNNFSCFKDATHCDKKIEAQKANSSPVIAMTKTDGTLVIKMLNSASLVLNISPNHDGKTIDYFGTELGKIALARGTLSRVKK